MNTTIIPAAASGRRPSAGVLVRTARGLVARRLRTLHSGAITLRDSIGTQRFGTPAADLCAAIHVQDLRFYPHLVLGGSLAAAESFIRGDWTTDDLTALLRIFVRNQPAADRLETGLARLLSPARLLWQAARANTRRGSRRNIHAHYDLGNDFFSLFLDETMTYSCAIFERPDSTLADASVAKLDRVCRKLALRPDDHVLEIGTGWGSFALYAAGIYGCRVTTTTISAEQHRLATRRVREAGLADRVEVRQEDYRDLRGRYDKLVSLEMIEAVGHRHLGAFFRRCGELLEDDGAMILQAITMPDQRYARYRRSVDFIRRYVFPGSCVPSLHAMLSATKRSTDFRLAHLEDLTPHYALTLRAWGQRFLARLDDVRALGYTEAFIRLWWYYLCYCEAGFAERYIGDVQLVLARPGCREQPILPPLPEPVA